MNLGLPLGTPSPVEGGLLHHMWRLETTAGVYAVKDLNPEVIGRPGVPENYRASEHIARRVAAANIPALPALQMLGDPLLVLCDRSVLVYDWLEGVTLPADAVMAGDARRIGELLGRIHALDIDVDDRVRPDGRAPDGASWRDLFERGALAKYDWAANAEARLEELSAWTRRYSQGTEALGFELVASHRDLDPKNVLWDSHGEPCLIDWESAGLVSPGVELMEVALAWSGQPIGPPKRSIFEAVVAGYRATGPSFESEPHAALECCLGGWLHWLHYNARRSLGDTGAEPAERALGADEAASTLETLQRLAAEMETWASWACESQS
jgi:Ser/Thr protein kinase RdoA (MazF antagonist)